MKSLDDSVEEIKETINRRGFVKVPVVEAPEGKESSFRRVAKFLLLIGVEQASKILPLLPQDQIEKLMIEIASIRYVDPEEATVILAEFKALSEKHDAIGGVEKAREILEATYGKEKASYMLEKAVFKAADRVGIRAVLGESVSSFFPSLDAKNIDEFLNDIWENLDEQNKISIYVRYIDLESGECENRLINKNK